MTFYDNFTWLITYEKLKNLKFLGKLNMWPNKWNPSIGQGFADLLKIIGTPAKSSVARGKTLGRQVGATQYLS